MVHEIERYQASGPGYDPSQEWGCDHETDAHLQALVDAAEGRPRHCPRCGSNAVFQARFGTVWWTEPRADYKEWWERWQKRGRPEGVDTISSDWSEPRAIPWLPPTHPNYRVTSPREARRVCQQWGIDPERGGFISERHRERAWAAAKRGGAAARRRAEIRRKNA